MVSHHAAMSDPREPKDDPVTGAPHDAEAEDRAAILRRRAMFVASAIAGLGLASSCGDGGPGPRPCLDIAIPEEPAADAGAPDAAGPDPDAGLPEPQPCLSIAQPVDPPPDAGSPPPADAGQPRPRPCLKMAPPRPCLDMPAPDPDDP